MSTKKANTPTDKKEQLEANKAEFKRLCSEQEHLYSPKFEGVFKALYKIAPGQREVYNTNGWNILATLPEAVDTDTLNRALSATRASAKIRRDFTRYVEIVLQGKRLMQQNVLLNIEIELANHPREKQPEGWRFYPMNIIAPPDLNRVINKVLQQDAKKGKGLFANITEIAELPDLELDEFLGVEVYNVVCSLQPYLGELKRYGVTGQTLGKKLTKCLFAYLKQIADHIKADTDKPEAVKMYVFMAIQKLDGIKIWGLIFQILTLQGLLSLLENCTLKEGENGYNEAQDLCNWIAELLSDKLLRFTFTGGLYGDGDKERLQPLCDYLYNTEIGRAVQQAIFERGHLNEQTSIANKLPDDIKTDRAIKYLTRAVGVGYMIPTDTGFKWIMGGKRGLLARLGYFVEKVYCPTNTEQLPEAAINSLFGVSRICSAITQLYNAKRPQKWRTEIDNKIFFD